jgi:hypothetical protein
MTKEKVWHDAGQRTSQIFTTRSGEMQVKHIKSDSNMEVMNVLTLGMIVHLCIVFKILLLNFSGVFLKNDVEYSFFVRAWYSDNSYAIFKSDGVKITTTKPATTTAKGSSVRQKEDQ